VVQSYTYDVFGAVKASSGTQGSEFQFAGEQTDPSGLQYLRARYYDAGSGPVLEPGSPTAPQSGGVHPYTCGVPAVSPAVSMPVASTVSR